MRPFNENRPENIECDNIWELYKQLVTLDAPYIKTRLKGDDTEYMYLITSACLESGDTKYMFDDMCNMNLPYRREETVRLSLVRMLCNEEISKETDISVNSHSDYDRKLAVSEILERYEIAFPDKDELQKTHFVRSIPVTYVEETPKHTTGRPHKGWRLTNKERAMGFRIYLDSEDICYKCDTDLGVPRITMIFDIPDCPVGHIESSIWFFERHAEVRTYYPKVVSDLCNSENGHTDELMMLLEYLNALVIPCQTDGEVYFTPRFYITAFGFDVAALTVINYKVWSAVPYTEKHITECWPVMFNDLAPFVVSVLEGKITADEAMKLIDKHVLKRDE